MTRNLSLTIRGFAALIAAVLVTVSAKPALAGEADSFAVINDGSHCIYAIYVSPSGNDSWGTDLLGSQELCSDQYVHPLAGWNIHGNCIQDVRVVWADGSHNDSYQWNICNTNLTYHY